MKNFYSSIILIILISIQSTYFSSAQTFQGDVYLHYQSDVDTFAANGYTRINGKLVIGDTLNFSNVNTNTSNITDLSALITLNTIDSSLIIKGAHDLLTLNGLDSLTHVGKSVSFYFNLSLQSLNGLGNIDSIPNHMMLNYCNALNNLQGLEDIQYINRLILSGNQSITSLQGIETHTSFDFLILINNPILNTLSALSNLTNITSGITMLKNNSLTSLSGLNNLESINTIRIKENESLEDFCALSTMYDNGYLDTFNVSNYHVEDNAFNPTFQQIIDNQCNPTSLSVNDVSLHPVHLTPNPTTGYINLNFESQSAKDLRVINQLGQIVYKKDNITESMYHFTLDVPVGLYTVEITAEEYKKQFKVIKQ